MGITGTSGVRTGSYPGSGCCSVETTGYRAATDMAFSLVAASSPLGRVESYRVLGTVAAGRVAFSADCFRNQNETGMISEMETWIHIADGRVWLRALSSSGDVLMDHRGQIDSRDLEKLLGSLLPER